MNADVDKLQSMYVRYKCQPEAQITSAGWDLATSQRYADQLAAEEQQAYVREESLLYNGLAPTSISLRITEAPAEFAVPVKQDRCACRSCAGGGGGGGLGGGAGLQPWGGVGVRLGR